MSDIGTANFVLVCCVRLESCWRDAACKDAIRACVGKGPGALFPLCCFKADLLCRLLFVLRCIINANTPKQCTRSGVFSEFLSAVLNDLMYLFKVGTVCVQVCSCVYMGTMQDKKHSEQETLEPTGISLACEEQSDNVSTRYHVHVLDS